MASWGIPLYTWEDKACLLEIIGNYLEHIPNCVVLIISENRYKGLENYGAQLRGENILFGF